MDSFAELVIATIHEYEKQKVTSLDLFFKFWLALEMNRYSNQIANHIRNPMSALTSTATDFSVLE